jgi:hypothetical protein
VLVLYTDGLVEHRSLPLDEGLATLINSVDEAIASSPDQPLVALLGRLQRANPEDDTCILAARPTTMSTPGEDQPLGTTPVVPGPTVLEVHDG